MAMLRHLIQSGIPERLKSGDGTRYFWDGVSLIRFDGAKADHATIIFHDSWELDNQQ